MAEQTFLSEGGVTVTNARFIVPAQTFAMSGVTSVKTLKEEPSRGFAILCIVVGVIALAAGASDGTGGAVMFGLLAGGIGVLLFKLQKATFWVSLSTASGEAKALTSKDQAFIERVVGALNSAIISRG